jgi:hypothetical protein
MPSSIINYIFGNSDCRKGLKGIIPRGQYYKKCPCDKSTCPNGYDNKFPNFTEIDKNPINKKIFELGYSGKTCGEISGNYPTNPSWDSDKFNKCVNLFNLQKDINNSLNNISKRTVSSIHKNAISLPINKNNILDSYNKAIYSPETGLPKRLLSFTDSLIANVKKDNSFLIRQSQSKEEIQKVNDNWNNLIGQLQEADETITNEMNVKTRLSEINNEASRQKSSTIMIIFGSFSALFISVLAWVGYMAGVISIMTMIGLFFVSMVVFFIFAVGLNKYVMKEFKKISNTLEKDIVHMGDELNIKALEWVDSNCNCPDDNSKKNNIISNKNKAKSAYNKMMEHEKYDDDSIYYDDGTLKQRILPADFARETGYRPCDVQDIKI